MIWFKRFGIILLFCISGLVWAQEGTCSTIIERAIETLADSCSGTGRNEACYGHHELSAIGRTSDFAFDAIGDIVSVTNIDTLNTVAYDETTGNWGIALLRLQANLPDTMPGENVTLIAFGGVELENSVDSSPLLSATINGSARVRSEPNTAPHTIITTLDVGTPVRVFGRNEAGDWVRIAYDNSSSEAWVATFLLNMTDDVMALPVVAVDASVPQTPMQSFILRQGISGIGCNTVPGGLLIHTPQGIGRVQITVNGVQVSMGSTIRILLDDNLQVEVFTGTAVVQTPDGGEIVPAGTFSQVDLSIDGTQPVATPTAPQPLSDDALAEIENIVTSEAYSRLVGEAPLAPDEVVALPEDDVPAAVDTVLAGYPALSGVYSFRNESVSGDCPTTDWIGRLDFNENGVAYSAGTDSRTLSATGDRTYGGSTMADTNVTFTFTSPTQVRMDVTSQCEWVNVGVWQSD